MRLTLRTLLAYLDDTLEPSQAKLIGQKVAESEQARELMEHIKAVTRRRRITTPPTSGPGSKIDPNTIAEYLDNAVSPEQASEVEQICLASDVHLAEVAACHQILALVLGEPSSVPPPAKQRMYALVKGPEAIPFRKPSTRSSKRGEYASNHEEADDTLRMGLPPMSTTAKRLAILGAGLLAASLLGLAIWQTLNLPGPVKPEPGPQVVVGPGEGEKRVLPETKEEPKPKPPEKKQKQDDLPPLPPPPKFEDIVQGKEPSPKPEASVLPDLRYFAPDDRPVSLGKYIVPPGRESSVAVASPVGKTEWKRLWGNHTEVLGGQTYVSLPGYRSDLQLTRDLKLTLAGLVPEMLPAPPLLESVVTLHHHEAFDVDLTLHRGRIIVTSTRADKPVIVRVRFENPTLAKEAEVADLALEKAGAQVLIDRFSFFPPGEPFYKDPKNVNRLGPASGLGFFVLKGPALVRVGDVTYAMPGPPKRALLVWNSMKGLGAPQAIETLPDAVSANPPPPQGIDKKVRDDILKAREGLSALLADKAVDVGLAEALKSQDPARRILATRSLAALGDVGGLVDLLDEEGFPEVRQASIRGLQHWAASSRDNEYKLAAQLKTRYGVGASEKIMELFHGLQDPQLLVEYLDNPALPIREMAYMTLFAMVPEGRTIGYNPTADQKKREAAQLKWGELVRKSGAKTK